MNNPYLKNFRIKVFDIETGGLSPQKSGIISASFIDPDTMELQQLFCEHPSQEGRMVRDILDILSECDAVVTYNGDSFDFLFLQSRAKQLGAGTSLPDFWSVDLYKWLKKYWSAAKLMEHHRQKDIELALGLSDDRTDKIDGGECIPLYAQYLAFGDEEAREKILLHNGDDVRQLAAIYNKTSFLPWHQIAFCEGFSLLTGSEPIRVRNGSLKGNSAAYKAKLAPGKLPASIYTDQYHLEYNSFTGEALLELRGEKKGDYIFLDLKALGIEDEALAGIRKLPGCQEDFLVFSKGADINYMELNALASMFFRRL